MDGADANVQTMLQAGIQAAQAKRKQEAYQLLSQVVRRDPQSEQGWLWLAAVAPSPQESLDAFGQVLAINPDNEQARVGRRWAMSRVESATAGARPAPPPALASAGPAAPAAPPAQGGPRTTPLGPLPTTDGETGAQAGASGAGLASASLLGVFAPATSGAAGPAPPPPPPARPEAAGTPAVQEPGGAEWRAAGDLGTVPAGVNWDDDGRELGSNPAIAGGPLPLPTEQASRVPEPYQPVLTPVGRRASMLPLLLGLVLMLAGLFVLLIGWNSLNAANQFSTAGERFFAAQLQPDYRTAAGLLMPDLQQKYAASNDLADIKLAATLAALPKPVHVQAAPLAAARDNKAAESVVTLTSDAGPVVRYLVHLSNAGDHWLIDQVRPYPMAGGAGATP